MISELLLILSEIINTRFYMVLTSIFFGSMITGYAGFGGGLLVLSIVAILFGPVVAIATIVPVFFVGLVPSAIQAYRKSDWREVGPVVFSSSIAIFVGLSFLVSSDPEIIKNLMGTFIILASCLMVTGWNYKGKRNFFSNIIVGGLTGGITGMSGVPGSPIMIIYYTSAQVAPDLKRANILMTGFLGMFLTVLGLSFRDIYTTEICIYAIILSPIFVIGARIGQYLFSILPSKWFRKFTIVLLFISGLSAIIF